MDTMHLGEPTPIDPGAAIETCRRIYRSAAGQFVERGVEPIDAAIAAIYAAHDLAMAAGMDPAAAIEWMRNAADAMEAQLIHGVAQ